MRPNWPITNNSSQLVSKINDIISDDYQFSSNSIDSLKPHIANLSGEYAVDRIIKILNENYTNEVSSSSLSLQYIKGKIHNESRTAIKKINSFKKNHINGSNFHQYRFPTLDIDTISDDVHKYANTMDRFSSVTVQQLDKHIFKLAC